MIQNLSRVRYPLSQPPGTPVDAPDRPFPFLTALVLIVGIIACAIYANLSFAVENPADYRYFPPFERGIDRNDNKHLGAEYLNIAQSLRRGEGFANPFPARTGPTAWMPPVLPALLAGMLWACDGDRDAVMTMVIFLQTYALIATAVLVLALARRTTRLWPCLVGLVFFLALLGDFHIWFQFTHDCWLLLLALDMLIAGAYWLRPLGRWWKSSAWGLFGGLCALINPIIGLAWGVLSLAAGVRDRTWSHLAVAILFAGLTIGPWTIRNYLVFDRLIPVKSNVAYELYQSQCLQPDGLIQHSTFGGHPFASSGQQRQQYKALGEIAFLEQKRALFWQAVRADPGDFLDRVTLRFLGATLWYTPFDRADAVKRPRTFWLNRLTHPLPFIALIVLIFSGIVRPLNPAQWTAIAVYGLLLLPYIGISYYERYAAPLLGVKVLLLVWAADRLRPLLASRAKSELRAGRSVFPHAVNPVARRSSCES